MGIITEQDMKDYVKILGIGYLDDGLIKDSLPIDSYAAGLTYGTRKVGLDMGRVNVQHVGRSSYKGITLDKNELDITEQMREAIKQATKQAIKSGLIEFGA